MAEKMTLQPCPFCGAPAAKNRNPGDRWVYYCPNGHTGYLRHKEWQARSHLAQSAKAVDVPYDNALNDAGWAFTEAMPVSLPGPVFNNVKPALKAAIEKWMQMRAIGNAQAEGWSVPEDMALIPRHYASNIQVAACMMEQSGSVLDRREAPILRKVAAMLASPTKATPNAHNEEVREAGE